MILVQENEFNEEDIIEIVPHDNDDEHVPAATLHELQAAELRDARDRALALASQVMHREETRVTDAGVSESAHSRDRVFKSGWDTTTIAHYDPSQEDSSQFVMDEEETMLLLHRARSARRRRRKRKVDVVIMIMWKPIVGQVRVINL